jgi:FixJ family two-component response regulator
MRHGSRVHIVDDEEDVRRALARLLRSEGLEVESHASGEAFLEGLEEHATGCVVLDVGMPGMSGPEVQERLLATGRAFAVVFLTGRGDIPTTVRTIKAGAVDFLTKPVRSAELLRAVEQALARVCAESTRRVEAAVHGQRLERLTPRERDVLAEVIAGRSNKLIGQRLGVAEQTVKLHRARVMEKLEVPSVAELVRFAQRAGIEPAA